MSEDGYSCQNTIKKLKSEIPLRNFNETFDKYRDRRQRYSYPIPNNRDHIKHDIVFSIYALYLSRNVFTLNHFKMIYRIGVGKFGIIWHAIEKISNKQVALKIVAKNRIESDKLYNQLQREIEIHSRLNFKNIVKLYAYFSDYTNVYMVLEYCMNGNLAYHLKKYEKLTTSAIRNIMRKLLEAVAYMKERNVMHRDIKLENVLLDKFYYPKLSDFGWCVHSRNSRKTFCGTVEYFSPEMIRKYEYGFYIDIYCLGIMFYELFMGKSPFVGSEEKYTIQKILYGKLYFNDEYRQVPNQAKYAIQLMLEQNKYQRPSAFTMLSHPFFKSELQNQNYEAIDKIK